MLQYLQTKWTSIKAPLDDTLHVYTIEQLKHDLTRIKQEALTQPDFDYDAAICMAEIDASQASEYNERFILLSAFYSIFAAFLIAIDFINSAFLKIFSATLFFLVGILIVTYRSKLSTKNSIAKQKVLLLKLAKEHHLKHTAKST